MPFIGNQPAEKYSAFQKQDFTTSATTSYTLDHPVANGNEIALFINFVRQEPTAAYTASGTSLTLTSATSSSDDMYCVFLGKAVQTVNPPNSSVGSSQVSADLITGQTALGATPADTDELLISDAGTLKRVDFSYLKSANTPAFALHKTSAQTVSTGAVTTVTWDASSIDTDSGVDLSNNKYVVPTGKGGTYFLDYHLGTSHGSRWIIGIKINGTVKIESDKTLDNSGIYGMYTVSGIISLSAGDEITATYYATHGGSTDIRHQNTGTAKLTRLEGYRLA
jgi:hypothetical protein